MPILLNGGWAIGPHVISLQSKRGPAFLKQCDPQTMFDNPREAVKFSLCNLDCLFLNFGDAVQIIAVLELVGFEASISDMNALDPPSALTTIQE